MTNAVVSSTGIDGWRQMATDGDPESTDCDPESTRDTGDASGGVGSVTSRDDVPVRPTGPFSDPEPIPSNSQ
ncbi:hypothetical protein ACFQE1_13280 [Halobium palmae]|uniref:Uncharacterized protein n=1 Tax=Halobium palmae TaxID=1776492 RepID=A0ABD5S0X1_9EURY